MNYAGTQSCERIRVLLSVLQAKVENLLELLKKIEEEILMDELKQPS